MNHTPTNAPVSGGPAVTPPTDLSDRQARIRQIGAEVRNGTYRPPIDGVVESLVVALLPHFGFRR